MTVIAGGRVVLPDRVVDGWIGLAGDRITGVGDGAPPPGTGAPEDAVVDAAGAYVLPGFVDIHCHGGGGAAFTAGGGDAARAAAAFHLRHGTTTMLASLVTAPVEMLTAQAGVLAGLAAEGVIAGVHFEGPFLAAKRCGAQDPAYLRAPDPAELDGLVAAARGQARMITVAPERPGALDLVRRAAAAGVVVAVGHTDATYAETRAAIDAGATVATHLFNGMRPLHHREPGPVLACLTAPEVTCELINDGVHLDERVVRFATTTGRSCLVTDAMSAAGMPDGGYRLGSQTVRVAGGVARLAGGDSIAGSTLTMDAAVRRAVTEVGLALPEASVAAALTPASVLGLADEVGSLATGKRADLVIMDPELRPRAVMRAGSWVTPPS